MTTPTPPGNPSDRTGELDTDVQGGSRSAGKGSQGPGNGGGPPLGGGGFGGGGHMGPSDPVLTALAAIEQAVQRSRKDIVAELSRAGNLGVRTGARRASQRAVNPTQGQGGDGFREDQDGDPAPTRSGATTDESGHRYSTLQARAAQRVGTRISQGAAEGSVRAGLGGAVAESGGTVAGLRMGLRAVPVVGEVAMAAETAGAGYNKFLDQANMSRSIQEIEGGSNAHATGTRVTRWGSRFHYLGEDRRTADAQFNTALELGYTDGTQRRAQTDWQAHQTTARGMSTEQEARTLQIAAQNGQTNLEGLTKSIYDVSKAANHAGVNAKLARDKFIDMFRLTTGSGMGQSANAVADALTTSVTNMGRQMNNVTFAGTQDRSFQYRLAAQAGMSPGAFQGASQRDPTFQARAITANTAQTIDSYLPAAVKSFIVSQINAAGGPSAVASSPGLANQIANMIVQDPSISGMVDTGVLADLLNSQAGMTGVTPDNAWQYVVQFIAGQTPAAAAQTLAQSSKPVGARSTAAGKLPVSAGAAGTGTTDQNLLAQGGADKHGFKYESVKVRHRFRPDTDKHNKAIEHYRDEVSQTGKRDPVIESLLQQVPDPDKARVEVQTGQGNKVMSLSQAVRDFPNELAAGQVRFVDVKDSVDGQGNKLGGRTTADVAGMSDAGRDTTSEIDASKKGGKTANTGQDAGAYRKKHEGDKGGGGNVTLTIAPPFDQIFRQMTGSSNGAAAGAGTPPVNNNAANPTR